MRRTAGQLFLAALVVALTASTAAAHSRIVATVPADGAMLAQAPARIVLAFANPLRLTGVRLVRGDRPAVDLRPGGGKAFATRFEIPLPGAGGEGGRGRYRIEWRGLSADGHAMRGRFAFRVE